MEQRLLRLGDNVDDYCPRERRITNHAVVAIVENAIRQTRCTTCDAEHVYKHGKAPRKKKKDEPATAFEEVLADVTGGQLVPARSQPVAPAEAPPEPALAAASEAGEAREDPQAQPEPPAHTDTWLAHRQLIRATLPRTDGELPPPRPIPEFTMHQRPAGRGGQFRQAYGRDGNTGGGNFRGRGNGNPNGNGNGNFHGNGNFNGNGNGPAPNGGRPGRSGRRRHRHKRPR